MAQERAGATTFLGNPLTLIGPVLKAGDPAPDFTLLSNDLKPVGLSDSAGKVRLISVVPSLDTRSVTSRAGDSTRRPPVWATAWWC